MSASPHDPRALLSVPDPIPIVNHEATEDPFEDAAVIRLSSICTVASRGERLRLRQLFEGAFKTACAHANVAIVDASVTIETQLNKECKHEKWHAAVKIRKAGGWESALASLACHFLRLARIHARALSDMPTLTAASRSFFPLRCITGTLNNALVSVSFCSFLDAGSIAVHWHIVSYEGGDWDQSIRADFHYDKREISAHYFNFEPYSVRVGNQQRVVPTKIKYRIKMDTESIRRIIIDQDEKGTRFRLFTVVSAPPKLMRAQFVPGPKGGRFLNEDHVTRLNRGRKYAERSSSDISECTVIGYEFNDQSCLYEMMSRLRHVTRGPVEFASLTSIDRISGDVCNGRELVEECPNEVAIDASTCKKSFRSSNGKLTPVHDCFDEQVMNILRAPWKKKLNMRGHEHVEVKIWRIRILLEGILQRGFEIRNQLLYRRERWLDFVNNVSIMYANGDSPRVNAEHEQKALVTMDRLINVITEPRVIHNFYDLFERERKSTFSSPFVFLFDKQMKDRGYTRVHRVFVTPTRVLYMGAETVMGNRVLNNYSMNGTEIIRVSFRDENGDLMRPQATGTKIIEGRLANAIHGILTNGLYLGGRHYQYLGSSNSQLREHGAYFIHVTDGGRVGKIRKELGNFEELENVPKYLARLGQCFTQARSVEDKHEATLKADETITGEDYVGGRKKEYDRNGNIVEGEKPYCFSDGVGQISKKKADQLAEANGYYPTPSAFQIRHKGAKGLVTVNPALDEQNEVRQTIGDFLPATHFVSRPSMEKFSTNEDKDADTKIEIVKHAQPTALCLNRPLLNIIDQVTSKQSAASNNRACARIQEMLRLQLTAAFKALVDEKEAREMLQEHVTGPLHVSELDCIQVTTEPHLRSLLHAIVQFMLKKQLRKMQIRLSPSMGRSVFGAIDDTGILQAGQVFLQISKNIGKKHAKRREAVGPASYRIHTGPVMVSKMPCVVGGDVRMFDAIDVPSLRHLVDVLVFPRHGPRPHADEMAGSDLDGDEYLAIFDSELFFDHNEKPMDFPSSDPEERWLLNMNTLVQKSAEFYAENVTAVGFGVLANAHLAQSDALGIEHPVCMSIARKYSQALDFQKSGKKPADLTTSQQYKNGGTDNLPAEKPSRKPDFMQKYRDPSYKSKGLMGRIYTEVERHISALAMAEHQIDKITIDHLIDYPRWGSYEEAAKKAYEEYNTQLKCLMEEYGIESEAEIVAGAILHTSSRITDKEADDIGIYSLNHVIAEKLSLIQRAFREDFFRPFCKWEDELSHFGTERLHVVKEADILEMRCDHPNERMMQKAVAYYRVAYEASNRAIGMGDDERVLLSFPWLVYDVIAHVRRKNLKKSLEEGEKEQADNEAKYNNRPLAIELSKLPAKYSNDESQRVAFADFKRKNSTGDGVLAQLMREYQNLAEHVFVLVEWARRAGVFERPRSIGEEHMVALVVCFALGKYDRYATNFIHPPSGEAREIMNGGNLLIDFLQWTSSQKFMSRSELGFFDVHPSVFSRGQWTSLHEAAVVSFLHLVVSHSLDLPLPGETTAAERAAAVLKEMTPFVAELPNDVMDSDSEMEQITAIVKRLSGVSVCAMRRNGNERVIVSAIGSFQSFEKLRSLMTIDAPGRDILTDNGKAKEVPRFLYDKILKAGGEAPLKTKAAQKK